MEFVHGKSEVFCVKGVPKLWPLTSVWTDKDVHDFVCDIGYGKYAKCFRNNAINGKQLLGITPFDLQRIGVKSMHEALHLHATIKAATNRMRYSTEEDLDGPPNISYSSTTRGNIMHNPNLPPKLQPENSSAFHTGMPPLPGHPYDIDWRALRLPYRRTGDRLASLHPRPPFRPADHISSLTTDKGDGWALYNKHFFKV